MRYLFFMLTVVWAAAGAPAQNVPQGPSPLNLSVYEEETNTVRKAEPSESQGALEGPSPLTLTPQEETAPGKGLPDRFQLPVDAAQDVAPGMLQMPGAPSGQTGSAAAPAQETLTPADQAKLAQASFLMEAGAQYAGEGEYAEAEQAYTRALQVLPGNPDIIFSISTLYIQMERYADAAVLLKRLAEAFPEHPMLHNNLSWVYSSGGEMKNGKLALHHAREALLAAPYAPAIWNTLAEAYFVSGQYDNALRASAHAIDLLNAQNGSETDMASFMNQYAKIQRTADAYKLLMDLDEDQ
jgi:tetratricopeptide (TPR) repeat protein